MAIILDGKKLSEKILDNLKESISRTGKKLRMAAVLVGDDPASLIFLKQKEKACKEVGIDFELHGFRQDVSQKDLVQAIKEIVQDPLNQGIIIQLPLPEQIDVQEVLNLIPPEKDIDVLSEKSSNAPILAPVLAGILYLFKEYEIDFKGKKIVVVGKGRLVGKPVAAWLEKQGMDFVAVDASTSDMSQFTKQADILISGTGKANLIKGHIVKEGVIVVDAARDVDFKSVFPKASHISPVPGGIGPMTVAAVIENLIILNEKKLFKS